MLFFVLDSIPLLNASDGGAEEIYLATCNPKG